MSSLACVKSQFTRTHVSPREGAHPELELLPVVLQIHPCGVWLPGKVMGWWVWVCGASPGPQHLGTTSTFSVQDGAQSLAKAHHAGLCLGPAQIITLAVNLGGPCSNLSKDTTRVPPQFTILRKKKIPAHKWFKSMTGGSRGEPILLLYSQEIMSLVVSVHGCAGNCHWAWNNQGVSLHAAKAVSCQNTRGLPKQLWESSEAAIAKL